MSLSKSSLTRALRSKITTQNPRVYGEAGHALAGATRNVTSARITSHNPYTSNFHTRQVRSVKISQFAKHSKKRNSSLLQISVFNPFATPPPPLVKLQRTPFDDMLNNITTHLTSVPRLRQKSTNTLPPFPHASLRVRSLALGEIRTCQSGQAVYPQLSVRGAWCFQLIAAGVDARQEEPCA